MPTPIADFVKKYAEGGATRFHMPGHKGSGAVGCEALDITEIRGADVLYSANGIIKESEDNASELFGSYHSFYSTEGSTLCIKSMLSLVLFAKENKGRARILAGRNAHKSFVYACALLDIDVDWMYGDKEDHLCCCSLTSEGVARNLESSETLPDAVYVTSPDYLGRMTDISGISMVCHSFGVPLLVDNAHGAYLRFLERSLHPLDLGADMCCDSAHKTLPVLTGGAYLHISKNSARFGTISHDDIRRRMALFASTSPSYLVLQSLDLCNEYLATEYRRTLDSMVHKIDDTRIKLKRMGFVIEDTDPCKIVINAEQSGICGNELSDVLFHGGIEVEFADRFFVVLMIAPENTDADLSKLIDILSGIELKGGREVEKNKKTAKPIAVMSIREAVLSKSETVNVEAAVGRICASPAVSCPPAVPIVVSGELIDRDAVNEFLKYNITEVDVVK